MKLLRNKRGVQLTMQTVIIAVLVMVVMIVLILIFTKGTGGFFRGVTSCEDRGGVCVTDSRSCTTSGGSVYRLGKCTDRVCCIPKENLLTEE